MLRYLTLKARILPCGFETSELTGTIGQTSETERLLFGLRLL